MTIATSDALTPADRQALALLHSVDPVWRGMSLARDTIDFGGRTILHAGPPIDPSCIASPILNSAINAALFEGWAETCDAAAAMIRGGDIRLAPAQDHAAMVPLAAVLSPNMMVNVVCDANDTGNRVYSPINGGGAFEARFGLGGERAVAYLRGINGNLAATLAIIADHDIRLIPIADAALTTGDDLHGRTSKASAILIGELGPRLGSDTPERRFLDAAPGFFLTLWMAACKCMARAAEARGSTIVTALGGNGVEVGLQIGSIPGRWFTQAAAPPDGELDKGFADDQRLGAIGDSALVDGLGFGAMLAASNPDAAAVLTQRHPGFPHSHAAVGLSVRQVAERGIAPRIALGILDEDGRHGRIGCGVYQSPLALFTQAASGLPSLHLNEEIDR